MLFAYEIASEKDGADRTMTISFDLDIAGFEPRFVQTMKDQFLLESLLLIVRASPVQTPGSIRSVHRSSPTVAQLATAGLTAEASNLTDWALQEFGDADEGVPNHGWALSGLLLDPGWRPPDRACRRHLDSHFRLCRPKDFERFEDFAFRAGYSNAVRRAFTEFEPAVRWAALKGKAWRAQQIELRPERRKRHAVA